MAESRGRCASGDPVLLSAKLGLLSEPLVNKPVIVAIVGIFAVVLAIALNFALEWGDDDPARRVGASADRPVATVQGTAPTSLPATSGDADGPTFDVVRINPQGDAVMAGRAKPGTRVEIYEGAQKIGEVDADRRGEWVFVPDQPLSPGSRRLSLVMRDKDGRTVAGSADVVIVVPEPGAEGAQALAMRVPKEGQPGSVEILQKPAKTAAAVPQGADAGLALAVEAVDYDADGKLDIVGKAPPGSLVQLYLDNEFLGRSQANERGQWSLKPANPVAAGNYLLRADQVEKDGKVMARVEVHFARSQPLKDIPPGALVVVREGNSLWRIARRTYGTGFKYTSIFEANRDQIKNADLIYPGQVFKLPQIN